MEVARSLQHIVDSPTLRWIFVGGKGGVGKTTTSASLGILMSQHRESVLIISTDPAHNLSDAFDQKIGPTPTPIRGVPNLHAMEIQPKIDTTNMDFPEFVGRQPDSATKELIGEMVSSIPGIDEAMGFAELMKSVQRMQYSLIIFDTAPTGHTLRLLNFPTIIDKGLAKIVSLKQSFGPMVSQISSLMGGAGQGEQIYNSVFERMEQLKLVVEQVNLQFKDPSRTTFVGVCIPEFLSLYETERLVQELIRFEIDINSIVINQVVFPQDQCNLCRSRRKMQDKYLSQIQDLYEDFHLITTPLLDEEVRGVDNLRNFSQFLVNPYK
jgi:arsenite/tail-anchored protein-transporting ATPase